MYSAPANDVYETEAVADSQVLGVIVISRNGDRVEYYQDPKTYEGSITNTTALGEVRGLLVILLIQRLTNLSFS